jgi:hypothetical protein
MQEKEQTLAIEYGADFPFTRVQNVALEDETLSTHAKLTYVILCKFADYKKADCYPSYATIARKVGCTRRETIICVKELVKQGYVAKRPGEKGQSNTYVIQPLYDYAEKKRQSGEPDSPPSEPGSPPVVNDVHPNTIQETRTNKHKKGGAADAAAGGEIISPPVRTKGTDRRTTRPSTGASPDDQALYAFVKSMFESKYGDFENYGREGKAIKQLIAKAKKDCPENPEEYLGKLINEYWKLTETGKPYWREKAFLPSKLNAGGVYPDVKKRLRESKLDPEVAAMLKEMAS